MGGRGNAGTRNNSTPKMESVTTLEKYTDKGWAKKIREDFNLDFATNSQIDSLYSLFSGIQRYDKSYGSEKEPFVIKELKIERASEYSKDISVQIVTEPNTDNFIIRDMDRKYRTFLLGTKGGFYTYNSKSKKVSIKEFDANYGMSFEKRYQGKY